MESPRKMSVQKSPTVRQIQPTGFLGCLDAIRAPTMGKARKEKKINSSLRVSPVLVGSCDEWARTCSTMLARNMATQRPASDQASQEAVRVLIALTLRSCSPASLFTTPLYSTSVSQASRGCIFLDARGPRGDAGGGGACAGQWPSRAYQHPAGPTCRPVLAWFGWG